MKEKYIHWRKKEQKYHVRIPINNSTLHSNKFVCFGCTKQLDEAIKIRDAVIEVLNEPWTDEKEIL